ncbi:response regulator [Paraliomyxa miuraensis]|uniref:response regulator n=1 Tax=Paraliomyxa miuraensis TaxID=376150 RepID=UPI00225B7F0E|nr:response regulator [Paraliomyxa miuraensis]MCX4244870.1 response regulator [Paraliomyxa miuraensis]
MTMPLWVRSALIEPVPAIESRKNGPLGVLLVEDDHLNQRVAWSMLQRLGHQVDVAEDGRGALDAVHRRRYDVVLMDVQMPVMDGLEATRQIRRDARLAQPYIVAVTAYTQKGDREDCLAAGMDEYLGKPFGLRELERVLTAGRVRVRVGAVS